MSELGATPEEVIDSLREQLADALRTGRVTGWRKQDGQTIWTTDFGKEFVEHSELAAQTRALDAANERIRMLSLHLDKACNEIERAWKAGTGITSVWCPDWLVHKKAREALAATADSQLSS